MTMRLLYISLFKVPLVRTALMLKTPRDFLLVATMDALAAEGFQVCRICKQEKWCTLQKSRHRPVWKHLFCSSLL